MSKSALSVTPSFLPLHLLPCAIVAASSHINAVTLKVVSILLNVSRAVALSSSWFWFGKFFPLLHDCSLLAILDEFGFICANSAGICFPSSWGLARVEVVVSPWELGILCHQEHLPPLCSPALGAVSAHLAGQAEGQWPLPLQQSAASSRLLFLLPQSGTSSRVLCSRAVGGPGFVSIYLLSRSCLRFKSRNC